MPLVDGTELRDQIAEDYARNSKRMGGSISMEHAQELAVSDLLTVDALDREAKPAFLPKPSTIIDEPEPSPDEKPNAAQMAQDLGGRFEKRDIKDAADVETLAVVNPEKRLKLVSRVNRLCSSSLEGEVMYPKFAALIAQVHANWNLNCRDYRLCRSQAERDRMFFRQLEDICDKSNSILPPWWLK
jgi:hypothetical protein